MLNYLWGGMMMLWNRLTPHSPDACPASPCRTGFLQRSNTLCITMIGIMSFWVGLMEIATKAGIIEQLSRKLKPLIHFLFPNLPDNHPAATHITTNIIANILGLGWAATPAGLNAMEELKNLEDDRRKYHLPGKVRAPGTASNEMCTFLIINISSLQLIPVNVIAYRSQYGSINPAAIVGPGILADRCKHISGRDILQM